MSEKFKKEYVKGICGVCGKISLVRPLLDEHSNLMFWGHSSKGGVIRICKECEGS